MENDIKHIQKPRIKIKTGIDYTAIEELLNNYSLNTVCREASCPNQIECFSNRTAAFLILGDKCTRHCSFCNVANGTPVALKSEEPENVGKAVRQMMLKHVVITSVTRDDLDDGGALHFAKTVNAVKSMNESVTIEVLIPDFNGSLDSLLTVINSEPDVINHNIETVKRLYPQIRPQADYYSSLALLKRVKNINDSIYTKSGIMLGLGETEKEVHQVITAIRNQNCDFLTIGQYLQPSKNKYAVKEYITESKFSEYKEYAYSLGFKFVASSPLVRSSYKAIEALRDQ